MRRKIEICPKCHDMILNPRDFAGLGWKICECDKKKEKKNEWNARPALYDRKPDDKKQI